MVTVLMSFAVVPFAPGIVVADLNIGLLFFLAMSSLGVYSVVLAGWSSNNKYALLGGLRAAAQMLSYEVFMGLSLMGVVMLAGSFSLRDIVEAQQDLWFCIPQFLGLVVFFDRRPGRDAPDPFDLPEAESELVAGYHTEYSGMKFGMFFVGEYLGITLISALIVTLFFGGWLGPVLPPVVWFVLKTFVFICAVHPAARRAAAAALRPADGAGWKVMLPLALLNLLVTGAVVLASADRGEPMLSLFEALWVVFLHAFRRRVTVQYPEQKPLPAAALARADHPLARPGRRGALRGLLPVRGRLPGGLHRPAGDRGRARPALPGVLPHQLLALHLLRLLRGGLPDLRHPAHAGLRDGRVPARRTWSTRRRTC